MGTYIRKVDEEDFNKSFRVFDELMESVEESSNGEKFIGDEHNSCRFIRVGNDTLDIVEKKLEDSDDEDTYLRDRAVDKMRRDVRENMDSPVYYFLA